MDANECIKNRITTAMLHYKEAEKDFQIAKKIYDYNIALIREDCKHEKTKFFPDPSGNNDSFIECQICWKIL